MKEQHKMSFFEGLRGLGRKVSREVVSLKDEMGKPPSLPEQRVLILTQVLQQVQNMQVQTGCSDAINACSVMHA